MDFSNPTSEASDQADSYTKNLLKLLDGRDPFDIQQKTVPQLRKIFSELNEKQLRQHEKPGKWSILQVVAHLADTGIVYGYRLRMMVAHDRPKIQGYDQDLWAERLHYNDQTPKDVLEKLATLRQSNLRFLRQLTEAEWERVGIHSERGEESVRHSFNLLAAHDLVHLRQINRIRASLEATG